MNTLRDEYFERRYQSLMYNPVLNNYNLLEFKKKYKQFIVGRLNGSLSTKICFIALNCNEGTPGIETIVNLDEVDANIFIHMAMLDAIAEIYEAADSIEKTIILNKFLSGSFYCSENNEIPHNKAIQTRVNKLKSAYDFKWTDDKKVPVGDKVILSGFINKSLYDSELVNVTQPSGNNIYYLLSNAIKYKFIREERKSDTIDLDNVVFINLISADNSGTNETTEVNYDLISPKAKITNIDIFLATLVQRGPLFFDALPALLFATLVASVVAAIILSCGTAIPVVGAGFIAAGAGTVAGLGMFYHKEIKETLYESLCTPEVTLA